MKFSEVCLDMSRRTVIQIEDVSESVLYDKSVEHSKLLSLLNATVSHELRNPLNSIVA